MLWIHPLTILNAQSTLTQIKTIFATTVEQNLKSPTLPNLPYAQSIRMKTAMKNATFVARTFPHPSLLYAQSIRTKTATTCVMLVVRFCLKRLNTLSTLVTLQQVFVLKTTSTVNLLLLPVLK